MLEIDAYNTVALFCKQIDPFPTALLQIGRRIIRRVECRLFVNQKTRTRCELVVMNDLVVLVQVGHEAVCSLERQGAVCDKGGFESSLQSHS